MCCGGVSYKGACVQTLWGCIKLWEKVEEIGQQGKEGQGCRQLTLGMNFQFFDICYTCNAKKFHKFNENGQMVPMVLNPIGIEPTFLKLDS